VDPGELDMTTFLNLMVALIPFLLVPAVFSRIAIVELSRPSTAGGAAAKEPEFRVEVMVRSAGLEIGNGSALIAALPKVDGDYDLVELSALVLSLKRDHPELEAASVLLEPDIAYDHLIRVMDVVRSAELPASDGAPATRVALFTDISIGDAP
jgi:biopolymer transport protein ExbD